MSTYGCLGRWAKKLAGRTDIEDALDRLDRLMQEESLMAVAQGLKATGDVDDKVEVVDDKIQQVDSRVQQVEGGIQRVDDSVRNIHDKIDVVVDGT
jgi:methyl-accepting chemotaxis protein